jgi:ABC-2 type transport system permease protein
MTHTQPSAQPLPRQFRLVNGVGLAAMIRRDVARGLKGYRHTVLGAAVSSLLYLLVFQLALGGDWQVAPGVPLILFVAPGLVSIAFCQRAFETSAGSIVFDRLEGMLADVIMAPLTTVERTIGYATSAAIGGLLAGATVAVVFLPFVALVPAHPLALTFFAVAGTTMHGLMGAVAGIWAKRWDHYTAAVMFFVIPLNFLSGAFWSIEALPSAARSLVAFNPIFHIINGIRYGFTGISEGSLALGVLLVLAGNAVLAVLLHRLLKAGWRMKA